MTDLEKVIEKADDCDPYTFSGRVKPLPDQSTLKRLFDYRGGRLIWKTRADNPGFNKRWAGLFVTGSADTNGYMRVRINREGYLYHRIVFAWHHGECPPILDHIDGDKTNNAIENLRGCNTRQNTVNAGPWRGRFKGVTWVTRDKKWVSQLRVNGECFRLGMFDSEVAAARAYDAKVIELNDGFNRLNFPQEGAAAFPCWRPIETAPKDGTEILACDGNNRAPDLSIVSWSCGRWVSMADGRAAIEAQGDLYTDYIEPFVTHWMPLPPAPEVK